IVGDGIGVAERIMGFALPGQLLVSRSFFEMVSRLSDDYGSLFKYDGNRTDANGRVHDLYLAGAAGKALATAERGARERKKVSSGERVVSTAPPAAKKPAAAKPERPKTTSAKAEPAKPEAPAKEKTQGVANAQVPATKQDAPDPTPMAAFSARSATLPPIAPVSATAQAEAAEPPPKPLAAAAVVDPSAGALVRFLEDRFKVGFVAVLLLLSAAILSLLLWQKSRPASDSQAISAAKPQAMPEPVAGKPEAAPQAPVAAAEKPAPQKSEEKPQPGKPAENRGATPLPGSPPAGVATKTAPVETPAKPQSAPAAPVKESPATVREAKPSAKEAPPARDEKPAAATRKAESPPAASAALVPPAPVAQPVQVPVAPPVTQPVERSAPAPAAPSTAVTKVSGAAVEFPVEAARAGVSSGRVKVRLRIDSSGTPTSVEILDSRPTRVFDRAVRNTMKDWRFNPGADNRTYEAEIEFNK
ncbi:MAG TPA: TonB family protein, partial [Usitatibacteraceae bacterium]|nr:TonB family protein [Usitatibacteraceae bacterium]